MRQILVDTCSAAAFLSPIVSGRKLANNLMRFLFGKRRTENLALFLTYNIFGIPPRPYKNCMINPRVVVIQKSFVGFFCAETFSSNLRSKLLAGDGLIALAFLDCLGFKLR
jgi:hypothetical protein